MGSAPAAGQMVGRRRQQDFPAFIDHVTEWIGPVAPVHVILDNVSSRKPVDVRE